MKGVEGEGTRGTRVLEFVGERKQPNTHRTHTHTLYAVGGLVLKGEEGRVVLSHHDDPTRFGG